MDRETAKAINDLKAKAGKEIKNVVMIYQIKLFNILKKLIFLR